jgi:ribonuclease Z
VVAAAKVATLLVHEATFTDDLQDAAIAKRHSTTSEALGVAAAAGAYRTLLTHFGMRYFRAPVLKPLQAVAAAGGDSTVGAACFGSDLAAVGSVLTAFDFMRVNLADLPWLPKMLPVLDELVKGENAAHAGDIDDEVDADDD